MSEQKKIIQYLNLITFIPCYKLPFNICYHCILTNAITKFMNMINEERIFFMANNSSQQIFTIATTYGRVIAIYYTNAMVYSLQEYKEFNLWIHEEYQQLIIQMGQYDNFNISKYITDNGSFIEKYYNLCKTNKIKMDDLDKEKQKLEQDKKNLELDRQKFEQERAKFTQEYNIIHKQLCDKNDHIEEKLELLKSQSEELFDTYY